MMKTKRHSRSSTCSLSEVPRTGHVVSREQQEGPHRGAPDNTSIMNHKYMRADVLTELKHLCTAPPSVPTRRPPPAHRSTVTDQGSRSDRESWQQTSPGGNKRRRLALLRRHTGGGLTSGVDERQRRRGPNSKGKQIWKGE